MFVIARGARDVLHARQPQGVPRHRIETDYLLRLYLPGDGLGGARAHVYPRSYLDALALSGQEFTSDTIRAFNRSSTGREAIEAAKAEFEKVFAAAIRRSPGKGRISVSEAAQALGTTPATVSKWIGRGLLEASVVGGIAVVDAKKLRSLLKWSH